MKRSVILSIRFVMFALLGIVLYQWLGALFKPYQTTSMMTDKAQSFYSEPQNTIEVLFLGSSTTADGFIPAQLFEEQGICSYNLGSASQPMLASLCWAKEAYRLHPQTLKTIVLDCSVLRYEPDESFYRLPLDEISLDSKIDSVTEMEGSSNDKLIYLDSLYAYHNRWDEIDGKELEKVSYPTHSFLRGYERSWQRCITDGDISLLTVPKTNPDESVEPTKLIDNEVSFFEQLAFYCAQRNITLIPVKTPLFDRWTDEDHLAVKQIASKYNLDFIDYNYEPFFSDTGYNQALDTRDGYHSNDYGAAKITRAIGIYLANNGLASDKRPDKAYRYMYKQALSYHAMTSDLENLRAHEDPVDYLGEALHNPNYTVYVGVDAFGAGALTPHQRWRLKELHLDWMAALRPDQCYYAEIEDGVVDKEEKATRADKRLYMHYDDVDFVLPRHDFFAMYKSDDEEAIKAMAFESMKNDPSIKNPERPQWVIADRGISIIVYDNTLGAVVDKALFGADTDLKRYCDPQTMLDRYLHLGANEQEMPWPLAELNFYNQRCKEARQPQEGENSGEVYEGYETIL